MATNNQSQLLRVGVAAKILGLHPVTVRIYANTGKLPCVRVGPRRERRFRRVDVEKLLHGSGAPQRTALYVRVSSSKGQETSLKNQEAELRKATSGSATSSASVVVFRDKASGLNEKRRGLARLRAAASRGEIDEVWSTHEDRLTRFGLGFLRAELEGYGVTVHVLHERADASAEQELIDDFMSLLACFSGRVYGQRSAEVRKKLLAEAAK